jgi:hypothetical protein
MKHLFKIPDYEGGFIHKSLENNFICTRDNEGMLKDIVPINVIESGDVIPQGVILAIGDNVVVAKDFTNRKTNVIRKSIANELLIKTKQPEIEQNPERLLSGTFETPIGLVRADAQSNSIRKALCYPDYIKHDKHEHIFICKSRYNEIRVKVRKPVIGKMFVEEVIVALLPKILIVEDQLPKDLIFKAFGISLKAPKITMGNVGSNRGERPGHKYIERKPNPNPKNPRDKYIYLYELPSGKVWKNGEGEEVQKEITTPGHTTPQNVDLNSFKPGEYATYKGQIARVKDTSPNYMWLEMENKKIYQINKQDYMKKVQDQTSYKIGNTISLGNGDMGTIKYISDSIILTKKADGESVYIRRAQPIEPYKSNEQKLQLKLPKVNNKVISSAQTVNGAYNQDDGFLMANYDYANQPEYQQFATTSQEGGFGKKNDLIFTKYVNTGDTTHQVSRHYNPQWKDVDTLIDGVADFKIRHGDTDYVIRDMDTEGYAGEDKDGDLFFINYKEHQKELEDEMNEPSTKTYHFSGELSPEQLERLERLKTKMNRFRGKRNSKTVDDLESDKCRQKEYEQSRDLLNQDTKKVVESQAYINSSAKLQRGGYELGDNKFYAQKKITVGDIPFTFNAQYDKEGERFNITQSKGKYDTVQIGGLNCPITDITEIDGTQFVCYKDADGNASAVSVDTLKELNGKRIFESTDLSKGIVSSKKPQLVYFTPKVKEYATWEVIELKDLIMSHHTDGRFNEKYSIKEAQNRDRTSEQSKRQVAGIANDIGENFDTFLPDFSSTVDYGAPTISKDYEVIAGNGRGLGIASSYENGSDVYKKKLIENADRLGFRPDDIEKMQEPVVVRRLAVDDIKRIHELGVQSNSDTKLAQTRTESGKAKAVLIDNSLFNKIADLFNDAKMEGGGTIREYLDKIGEPLVNEMLKRGVIADNELPNYYDLKSKKLLPEQKDKIKDIITQRLFGENGEHLDYLPDATQRGITDSIGDIMSLKGKLGDISEDLGKALRILRLYETEKESFKDDVNGFLRQEENNRLDPLNANSKTVALVETLANKTQKEIRGTIKNYTFDLAGDMFSSGMSPEEAFSKNFKTTFPGGIGAKEPMIGKSLFSSMRKAIDKAKNILTWSRKNPEVKRWQSTGNKDQLSLFDVSVNASAERQMLNNKKSD